MKSKFLNVKKFSINLHFILISSFQLMALPSFSESIVDCQLSVCSSACTVPPSLPFLTSLLFQFLPTFCLLSLNQSLLISCHSSVFPDSFNEIITSSYYSRAPTYNWCLINFKFVVIFSQILKVDLKSELIRLVSSIIIHA